MLNLSSMIQAAQGGQAIDNLASEFGLSSVEARQAVEALLPALSAGLKNKAADPAALGGLLKHLSDPQHQATFQNADAAQLDEAQMSGSQALEYIMGGQDAIASVARRAADATGLSPELLQQMMPQIASIALGGMMTGAKDRGLGGVIGQLGQMAGSGGQSSGSQSGAGPQGGLGGLLGGIVGSLLGGRPQADGEAPSQDIDSATAQNSLQSLTSLFEHGTGAIPDLEQDFAKLLAKT